MGALPPHFASQVTLVPGRMTWASYQSQRAEALWGFVGGRGRFPSGGALGDVVAGVILPLDRGLTSLIEEDVREMCLGSRMQLRRG